MFRTEQEQEFVAGAADAARSNGKDGVAGPGVSEEKANAVLHGPDVVDVFMARFTDGGGQGFARNTRDGLFAGGVDVRYDQNVSLIEGARKFFP